jgi:hypothetical protein
VRYALLSHRQTNRFTDGDNYILEKKCLDAKQIRFIYGALGANNSGYSGRFTMGWGGGVVVGGFGSVGNGVKVGGVSIGAHLTTTPAGRVSATQTLPPLTMGNALANPAAMPLDQALILARQAVC